MADSPHLTLEQVLDSMTLKEIEKWAIEKRLALHAGDKRAAAESLGICMKTFYNRLNRYRESEG